MLYGVDSAPLGAQHNGEKFLSTAELAKDLVDIRRRARTWTSLRNTTPTTS